MVEKIQWLGHSSVKIEGEKTIFIDPWKLDTEEKADIILISHSHRDHLSLEDVKNLSKDDTVVVTTQDSAEQLSGNVKTLKPGDSVVIDGILVEAVPAYNLNKDFHPKENNWIGFVITVNGKRIYYCGDTDRIPEMNDLSANIVIVPVGGKYTMTAEEAAEAVNLIKPELAIPIHYGDIIGSENDALRFKEMCNVPVTIKPFIVNNSTFAGAKSL